MRDSKRGADAPDGNLIPQSEGLVAIAAGLSLNSRDDYDNMAKQFNVCDALQIRQEGDFESPLTKSC